MGGAETETLLPDYFYCAGRGRLLTFRLAKTCGYIMLFLPDLNLNLNQSAVNNAYWFICFARLLSILMPSGTAKCKLIAESLSYVPRLEIFSQMLTKRFIVANRIDMPCRSCICLLKTQLRCNSLCHCSLL